MTLEQAREWAKRINATGQRTWLDRNPLKPSEYTIILPRDDYGAAPWMIVEQDCVEWLAENGE